MRSPGGCASTACATAVTNCPTGCTGCTGGIEIQDIAPVGAGEVLYVARAADITSASDWMENALIQWPLPTADAVAQIAVDGCGPRTVFAAKTALWPWSIAQGLWRRAEAAGDWTQIVPGPGATNARRFFVNPRDKTEVYILDDDGVKFLDDDGGTWLPATTANGNNLDQMARTGFAVGQPGGELPFWELLVDMHFDDVDGKRFAVGTAGVFYRPSVTPGSPWTKILSTDEVPMHPTGLAYDAERRDLYVACFGRGILRFKVD